MRCSICNAELSKDAVFCENCGNPVQREPQKGFPLLLVLIGAVGLIIATIIMVILMVGKKNEKQVSVESMTPLYSISDVAVIDTYARNYTPGIKQEGIKWDSSLFYWLEDIDQTTNEDGYLAKCHISKTLLRSADTQELIQYEIYRDPQTGVIYKIVSIEPKDGQLELIDYYYDESGKPNFAFKRTDSVYTPTYATIGKVGERYYFNNDVMARWRLINEPSKVSEYVLALTDGGTWYVQSSYFAETDAVRGLYDETEINMLNAAYNTYNAVSAQSIGIVEGKVQDTTRTALAGLTVDILRAEDDVLLYRGTTDENGMFRILTYLDNTECYIVIRGSKSYKEKIIYGVVLSDNNISNNLNDLLLHKISGDEYPIHMNMFDAVQVSNSEDGTLVRNNIQGATVYIRSGAGAYTGEIIATVQADAAGSINVNLQSGTYTAQIEVPGYSVSYLEIEVLEEERFVETYLIPTLESGQTAIVMTWEGTDIDLDLTLFTPTQAEDGDMAHINALMMSDGNGNQLIADNKAGCEVMYVNTAEIGNYKLYVNNYTDSISGNFSTYNLSKLNIHIYIYDSNGFMTEYTFPAGEEGVVWEVAEINGNHIIPSNRVYSSVTGKSWWTQNKEIASEEKLIEALSEDNHLNKLLTNIVHYYIGNGRGDTEKNITTNINQLCDGQIDQILKFWGVNGELPPHIPPIEVYNSFEGYGYFYYMSKMQMEYAAYSLTGEKISFDSIDTTLWIDKEYVGFGGYSGDISSNELRNVVVEYIGNNTYRVGADVWYYFDGGYAITTEEYKVGNITFMVKGNADSCYNGFSLLGVEALKIDSNEWKNAYLEIIDSTLDNEWSLSDTLFALIHLDDDGVPELVKDYSGYELSVYTYNEGKAYKIIDDWGYGTWGRVYSYLPYGNSVCESCYDFIEDNSMYHTIYYWNFYPIENLNGVVTIGQNWNDFKIYVGDVYAKYELNGNESTKEQFEEYVNPYKELNGELYKGDIRSTLEY